MLMPSSLYINEVFFCFFSPWEATGSLLLSYFWNISVMYIDFDSIFNHFTGQLVSPFNPETHVLQLCKIFSNYFVTNSFPSFVCSLFLQFLLFGYWMSWIGLLIFFNLFYSILNDFISFANLCEISSPFSSRSSVEIVIFALLISRSFFFCSLIEKKHSFLFGGTSNMMRMLLSVA